MLLHIMQNICSWGVWSWKTVLFLQNLENALLEFWTRSPGKFYPFLLYFFLLENRMYSCRILRKLSWKFWCVLVHFASPGKFICVLVPFGSPGKWKKLVCSYERIMSSPGKFICVLITSKPPGKFDVFSKSL